jgi:imidazole glycerol-phosphate synthase subunit HisF
MYLGASAALFGAAKQLRQSETAAEKFLWSRLSRNQLGVNFRRQHPIYTYVADFYCHSHRLIVEVDGPIHDTEENRFYDFQRTAGFDEFNIELIRFTNEEVMNDIEDVLRRILKCLNTRSKLDSAS